MTREQYIRMTEATRRAADRLLYAQSTAENIAKCRKYAAAEPA